MGRHQPSAAEREAITLLLNAGYVVVRAKSQQRLHERVRVAEARMADAREEQAHTRRWAEGLCDEIRQTRNRVVFVYGVARAHGATDAELAGEPPAPTPVLNMVTLPAGEKACRCDEPKVAEVRGTQPALGWWRCLRCRDLVL